VKQQLPLAKSSPVPEKPERWITSKDVPPDQIVDPIRIEALLRHRCVMQATRRRREEDVQV
jgi:hypothetical protein